MVTLKENELQFLLQQSIIEWGENHFDTGLKYGQLAEYYYEKGQLKEAKKHYEKGLDIMRFRCSNVVGEAESVILDYGSNLARCHHGLGQVDEGYKLLLDLSEHFKDNLNKLDKQPWNKRLYFLEFIEINLNLADYLSSYKGRELEAIPFYEEIDKLYQEDEEIDAMLKIVYKALIQNRIGTIFERIDNYSQAIEHYQNALDYLLTIYDGSHYDILWVKNRIAECKDKGNL